LALLLVCGSAATFPSLAAAGNTLLTGVKPAVEGIGFCQLEANGGGEPGEHLSETAAFLSGGGFADDGTVKKWSYTGSHGGSASISLDILEPGFATHPVIEAQYRSPYEEIYGPNVNVIVTENISVIAGQGIGVTVSADPDPNKTQANDAEVQCFGSANSQSVVGLWETALTVGASVAPSKQGPGEVMVGAQSIEYDAPVIESVSPEEGPAAGGTEVTIKGKHLANASVEFPENGTIVQPVSVVAGDSEIKVITPEAVTGAPSGLTLETRATGKSTTHNFKYVGTPRSRTPQLVLDPVTNITESSAEVHATVNVEGLIANYEDEPGTYCYFGYGVVEVEEETVECDPLPEAFSETPEAVSARLEGLSPGTTYHYLLEVASKYSLRGGHAATDDTASFKTLGIGEKSEEEKTKEAEATKEAEKSPPAKELIATITAPSTPQPIVPPKGLVATIPVVGLLGGGSATATPAGVVPIKVSCPAGETSCIGSITLTSIGAVGASAHETKAKKKSAVTLAAGSFTVAGGKTATVQLHLSSKAKALLKHSHSIHAQATILAHDSSGATHTTKTTITIYAAKPGHMR
jgi:hypothetical protein